MSAAAFVTGLPHMHGQHGLADHVVEFQRLDQIGVEHHRTIGGPDIGHPLIDSVNLAHAFIEDFAGAEHAGIGLHRLLHGQSYFSSRAAALGITEAVEAAEREIGVVLGQRSVASVCLLDSGDAVRRGSAENNQVDQAVGTKPVGTVHRNAGGFTHREKAGHHAVGVAIFQGHDFTMIVRRNTTHVVVHGWHHWDRRLGDVHTGKNLGGFRNAGQALGQHGGIDVIEVQVDMVAFSADTAAFADFHRHRTADDVAAGKILGRRSIAFHETLTLAVGEVTALPARTFGDQHAGAIDAGGVELHEFHVLHGNAGADRHAAPVPGGGVRGCG